MSSFCYETVVIASKIGRSNEVMMLGVPKAVLLKKRVFAVVPHAYTFQNAAKQHMLYPTWERGPEESKVFSSWLTEHIKTSSVLLSTLERNSYLEPYLTRSSPSMPRMLIKNHWKSLISFPEFWVVFLFTTSQSSEINKLFGIWFLSLHGILWG